MTFVAENLNLLEVGELHPDDRLSALAVLVPKRLGAGVFRDVFEVAGRPDIVLKIERRGMEFCNVLEWSTWKSAGPDAKRWLAPCVDISHDGRALLMKRTRPVPDRVWKSLSVPRWLDDVQQHNWGLFEGRVVCHDYGFAANVLRVGSRGKALRAVATEG